MLHYVPCTSTDYRPDQTSITCICTRAREQFNRRVKARLAVARPARQKGGWGHHYNNNGDDNLQLYPVLAFIYLMDRAGSVDCHQEFFVGACTYCTVQTRRCYTAWPSLAKSKKEEKKKKKEEITGRTALVESCRSTGVYCTPYIL